MGGAGFESDSGFQGISQRPIRTFFSVFCFAVLKRLYIIFVIYIYSERERRVC